MELLLIRHGLPERVDGGAGPADPKLSATGLVQAGSLAASLAEEPLAAVVTSPLRRARETAAPLAAAHGLEPRVEDGLAEFDRDTSWYVPMEELRAAGDPRWQAIVEGRWSEDHGVDVETFRRAAVAAIELVIAAHSGHTVAVVTHGGVINAYVADVLRAPLLGVFEPSYTSVSRVLASRGHVRTISSLNDASHLRTGPPALAPLPQN